MSDWTNAIASASRLQDSRGKRQVGDASLWNVATYPVGTKKARTLENRAVLAGNFAPAGNSECNKP
jgi:hypothetical protein